MQDPSEADRSPHPEVAAQRLVDLTVLDRLWSMLGEEAAEAVPELIGKFIDTASDLSRMMQQALVASDTAMLHRAAHTLKSNSTLFGAHQLAARCAALEKATHATTPPDAAAQVQQITDMLGRVTAILQAEQHRPRPAPDSPSEP